MSSSVSRPAHKEQNLRRTILSLLILVPVWLVWLAGPTPAQPLGPQSVFAAEDQTAGPEGQPAVDPEALAEQALAADQPDPEAQATGSADQQAEKINLWQLARRGGKLMLPILIMSLLVVAFGVERILGLRRHKVLPTQLIDGLGRLASQKGGLDPRQAYKICQQYPSAAANVLKVMLLKVGRPHNEVEHAVSEASQREAARLYANVRWLTLAAGVTPLMGLLGTVWGMIQAFIVTANMPLSQNRTENLAEGIYVALVTTLFGLSVAIPAAILAHFLEGRIQQLLRELDEMLLGLMPQLERFEGRLRVSKESVEAPDVDGLREELAPAQTRARGEGGREGPSKQPAATPK